LPPLSTIRAVGLPRRHAFDAVIGMPIQRQVTRHAGHSRRPVEATAIERHQSTSIRRPAMVVCRSGSRSHVEVLRRPAQGKRPMPDASHAHNQRTVAGYERCARDYAAELSSTPSAEGAVALRQLAEAVAPNRVLEVGSGPGWDADFLETLGVDVHRTDVTAAFRDFQAERGKHCEPLDVLTDEIAGRYHGIVMLYVLQHFERHELDAVLSKMAQALHPSGVLLLSYAEGDDECWQHGDSGDYRVVRWTREAFDARLTRAGFVLAWVHAFEGKDLPWRIVLAQRQA
jgi:SAM-dependent methyltransferase